MTLPFQRSVLLRRLEDAFQEFLLQMLCPLPSDRVRIPRRSQWLQGTHLSFLAEETCEMCYPTSTPDGGIPLPPGKAGLPLPSTTAPLLSISGNPILCFGVRGALAELLYSCNSTSPVSGLRPARSTLVRTPLGVLRVSWGDKSSVPRCCSNRCSCCSYASPLARFVATSSARDARLPAVAPLAENELAPSGLGEG